MADKPPLDNAELTRKLEEHKVDLDAIKQKVFRVLRVPNFKEENEK